MTRLATKIMRKLLSKQGFAPKTLVTDKLRSYGAANIQLGLSARHEQGLRKNNRVENSHLPVRRRERKMQRFKSPGLSRQSLLHPTRGRMDVIVVYKVGRRTRATAIRVIDI